MKHFNLVSLTIFLLSAGLAAPLSAQSSDLPPPAGKTVDFSRDVAPLLESRCYLCHGPQQQMKGLRLDRAEDALRGGESGAVIRPGDSARSRLIQLVAGVIPDQVMPPGGKGLSSDEVGLLRAWIDQGARWPEVDAGTVAKTRAESSHWAFRSLVRPVPPAVKDSAWVRNPVDRFVLAKLEAEGIRPSPEADRSTLIRRLSLDLTGLPPTLTELDAFLSEDGDRAYENAVDRFLESPHFGEKWARHWLDLARYSDSDGYRQDDFRRHAWRYRHWVIQALNRDMPFDRFTVEQIAGDLLPDGGIEARVATGFHRNTPSNREGGTNMVQFRFEQVINRINTVGTVWLGLTVGCAQCHDHKYDPLSQKDYYRLFSFFNDAEEVNIDAPLPGEMGPYLREVASYRKKRAELLAEYRVPELQPAWEAKLMEAMANPGRWQNWDKALGTVRVGDMHPVYGMGEKILRKDPSERSEKEAKILTEHFVRYSSQVVPKKVYEEKLKFGELLKKLKELEAGFPALSQAQTIATEADGRSTNIHVRGEFNRMGDPVEPGVPGFLHPELDDSSPPRMRLADWIVSPENPLTARVTANRLWQELFGRGIVFTTENFGLQGEEPSHPQLLDWLASDFRENGWSLKGAIKTVVMSATYRQSSAVRAELQSRDPDNVLLARQARMRLPAELIRDSALAVSGLLNPAVGGKSVRPPQPGGKMQRRKWVESEGQDRYRRGLYIQYQRMFPYPFLANFDMPGGYEAVCRRGRSNSPLQALNLLNDEVFFEAAQALAVRILTEGPEDPRARLEHAFRLCLARSPADEELDWLETAMRRQTEILEKEQELAQLTLPVEFPGLAPSEAASWVGAGRILLNLDEFITRE